VKTVGIRVNDMARRRRFTLMPAIALAALSLMVALPTLSGARLYAASAQRYVTVTVRPGDTLWTIATAHSRASSDVQETVDRISDANGLHGGTLQPGERLRIPE
jgi:Tfp pilus assembly protein FimV